MIMGLVEDYIMGDHRLLPELLFALSLMLQVFCFVLFCFFNFSTLFLISQLFFFFLGG